MALLLAWAVSAVSAGHAISHPDRQNVVSTNTSTFTIYIPATFGDYVGCTKSPALISPTNGSHLSTIAPLYRWDNGNNPIATEERLQVAKDPGFTQIVESLWSSGNIAGVSQFRFPGNLAPATTYYWRARLVCGDRNGPYSEVWSFTTGSGGAVLPAPALVAPADRITVPNTTVTLQWSPVPGAVEYLLHWREVGETGLSYRWMNATKVTWRWRANTTYEWWVSARNDYAIGTDSEIWHFTTPAGSGSSQGADHSFVLEEGGFAGENASFSFR